MRGLTRSRLSWLWLPRSAIAGAILLASTAPAQAYIGPGAGFTMAASFFFLFVAIAMAFATLLTWPVRWILKALLQRRRLSKSRVKRVIILGLDGQDPELTERFMAEGLLPNFSRLQNSGSFTRLQTSYPAESPVAWSCFQTGCNPGKHRVYDFLVPNRKTLLPELSSARVDGPARVLKLGKYRIPLGQPRLLMRRQSRPFWQILSDYGICSSILRVPITFPPEKLKGVLLSAMAVPDLRGSQGTFFYYTTDATDQRALVSGMQLPLERRGQTASGRLPGPENSLVAGGAEIQVSFEITPATDPQRATLAIGDQKWPLKVGDYTPWISIAFPAGLGIKAHGICRFLLLGSMPHVRLYVTPIQIDPEQPALPVSYPKTYSVYLAKQQGPFATLGVAEDTSALNEEVIEEDDFAEQCRAIHVERERMFFDALEKTPRGAAVCVFDITDRIQHMFFRFLDPDHPTHRVRPRSGHENVIRELYQSMDDLVGRTLKHVDEETLLLVMSDHGFKPFRRCVELNAWLQSAGYLFTKPGAADRDLLQAIDWSRTKAYAVGFGGIFLNVAGRESHGIVKSGPELESLKAEIRERLLSLKDEAHGVQPIREVYDRNRIYSGPYLGEAPDLLAGMRVGYRVAWETVTGRVGKQVFEDNVRPWSGDHNMNPPDVPGMLFSNRKIQKQQPHIMDIGPSVLDLFGLPIPAYCDGESLFPSQPLHRTKPQPAL